MTRFLGIQNNRITIVSDKNFSHDSVQVIEEPNYLSTISAKDLIQNYKLHNGRITSKFSKRSIKDLKIAFVGNWKMKCGISTYSENLWPEIIKHVGDFKIFAEFNDNPTGPSNLIGNAYYSNDKVIECWKRGDSLKDLTQEIKNYNPDIVFIQHEFGLWSNAMHWLSFMNQISEYRVIVTMHSVFHHKDKTICEAAMPEIVTHLQGGADVLKKEKQIPGKVYVISHGCYPCDNSNKLWNYYKSEHTFVQFGFGFRYKNFEDSIRATSILKEKYSDIFFTGLFSESQFSQMEHQHYYDELMQLVDQLNIKENVAILRGFQSDATLDSYLRTNQATVFPYISHPEHEVYGASGAARLAIAKAIPVITSSIPHFSDLPTIKADSPEEIAIALDKLFSSNQEKQTQINKQLDYLNDNTWEKVAATYINLFENP